ncbi:MAG: hypothetical protein WC643_02180 [Parcubacteria group bacterium]|jgi:hypothetical protein
MISGNGWLWIRCSKKYPFVVQLLYREKAFFGKSQKAAVCLWAKNVLESLQSKNFLAQKQKQSYAEEIRQKKNNNREKR